MITSISIEAIEQQLLRQLSSFFFLTEEDKMLIKAKMGGWFLVVSIAFLIQRISIIHVTAKHTSILTKVHNIQSSFISFPIRFLKKLTTVY